IDPFPDRVFYEGPDPTLSSIDRVFQAAINSHLRETLGVETDLDYQLLSYEVNSEWTEKDSKRIFRQQVGAMDDLRYGMSLNPHMQVRISHGYFDLVTPYFSSNRLIEHMKLDDSLRGNLTTEHYLGGHMFYTWELSRKAFSKSMEQFYKNAIP
ncbi:MAG: peptidase S10, partial [Candidatus Latescibacteria bacterium]|nr:peptidase S10 [Candidatus Latescibacterota bacterium]